MNFCVFMGSFCWQLEQHQTVGVNINTRKGKNSKSHEALSCYPGDHNQTDKIHSISPGQFSLRTGVVEVCADRQERQVSGRIGIIIKFLSDVDSESRT